MESIRECSIDECTRPHRGRGFCNAHLLMLQRTGDPLGSRRQPRLVKTCATADCASVVLARGLCLPHYRRAFIANGWGGDPGPCAVDGCEKPNSRARGMCRAHHAIALRRERNPDRRETRKGGVLDRVVPDLNIGICWEWTGQTNGRGYGLIGYEMKMWYVHRLIWVTLVGPIPEGLELDHLCENQPCCNPDHLEPVTHAENTRRHFARRYA